MTHLACTDRDERWSYPASSSSNDVSRTNGAHLEDDTMSDGRRPHEDNYRDWNHRHETRGDYVPVALPRPEPRRAEFYMAERDTTELTVAVRGRERHDPYERYSQHNQPECYYENAPFSRDAAHIVRGEEERSKPLSISG